MTYYRFRVAGREARDISTVFNFALSRVRGKESPKKSFSYAGGSNPNQSSGTGTVAAFLRSGCTRTRDPDPIRFANEADLLSPAGWKNGAALPRGSSPATATFIASEPEETKRGYYSTSGAQEPQGV